MADKTEKKHFTTVPQAFTRCGGSLSLAEKAVMLYLYSNTKGFNAQGVTRPLIAAMSGVSERAVTAALKGLAEKKAISVCRRNIPGTKKSCLSITLLPFPDKLEQCANTAHAKFAGANFAGANFAHIDPSSTVDPSSSTRSTPSTVDHSLKSTTTAAPPAASASGASGGAGGAAEPDGDVLDDVYQEFVEKRREKEFDRFLRYNRQRGWSMGAYDAAHEWLSKERPDRSRKPKAAGSGGKEQSADFAEAGRLCTALREKDGTLAVRASGWLRVASDYIRHPQMAEGVRRRLAEFIRRCPEFLSGKDAGFPDFVAELA